MSEEKVECTGEKIQEKMLVSELPKKCVMTTRYYYYGGQQKLISDCPDISKVTKAVSQAVLGLVSSDGISFLNEEFPEVTITINLKLTEATHEDGNCWTNKD